MKSNNLAKMIGKRVVQSCITILLVTLFVFALIQMVPGDPVANYLGATATEEQITYYRHLYGFDRPVIVQYLSWIGGLFRGTMGQSISYQSEIADIILPRLGTTLTMVIPAFIIGTITGILFGIIAAKNRGKVIDSVISFFANIGVSMPMFWLGMMGMLVFALKLRVLPSSGYVPITRDFGGWLSHMIMPIIVLSLGVNAGFVRLTRSSMLEVMRQDYVTTARAKGVSKKDVTFRHQLRNSMIPIVTTMGMRLGSMVGSTVLIESLFVIPGLDDEWHQQPRLHAGGERCAHHLHLCCYLQPRGRYPVRHHRSPHPLKGGMNCGKQDKKEGSAGSYHVLPRVPGHVQPQDHRGLRNFASHHGAYRHLRTGDCSL